jgi:hypothetical protein
VVREDSENMPSLGRFRRGLDEPWFTVVAPGGRYEIDVATGSFRSIGSSRWSILVGVGLMVLSVFCAGVALLITGQWGAALGVVAVGVLLGLIVGTNIGAAVDRTIHRRKDAEDRAKNRVGGYVVTRAYERAWMFCELADGTARTESWDDFTVDADRKVPELLFAAVQRALATDDSHNDAAKALQHESLRELAEQTLAAVRWERADLDAIRGNLESVLATARKIDQRHLEDETDQREERRRRAEEADLLRRLSKHDLSQADRLISEDRADESAGLAAEVAYVADVLVKSDNLLRNPTGEPGLR